jgi:hypothetical protein
VKHDARRAFLGELIDDAGLFPPARLAMREALAARERALASDAFWTVGRFVVPGSRLAELARELDAAPRPLAITVVVDSPEPASAFEALAITARANAERLALEALECPLARFEGSGDDERLSALERAFAGAQFDERPDVYAELRLDEDVGTQVAALRRARARGFEIAAKVRCGGPDAAAIPACEALAQFLWTANRLEVPFKATAGLHHPLRRLDAGLGATAHGFLNAVGGAVLARARGLDLRTLEALLADEDPAHFGLDESAFTWSGIGADAAEVGEARACFVHSYGSCSLTEPIDDLRALAILPATLT